MERKLGKAIWAARKAAKLSQKELSERLGIRAQTIRRWEWEDTFPSPTKRAALVEEILSVNPEAARKLARALDIEPNRAPAGADVAQSASTSANGSLTIDFAIFKMSDDLDATPRRVRSSVLELVKRLRAANLSMEEVERHLEDRNARSQVD